MKTFTLTEEHVKLLRSMYVDWQGCETGAPAVDPKRPYGNSFVAGDVHWILTGERRGLTDAEIEQYLTLHRQTDTALEIVLAAGSFVPGNFEASSIGRDWRRVGEVRT